MALEDDKQPYYQLGPEQVLDAVESIGIRADGRLLELNSYENRVYQVGVEDGAPVVGKFYRPGRWSDEAILEEHAFTLALAELEIPAVPPLIDAEGRTLHHHAGFRFSLYPRRGGRAPELDDPDNLVWLGRYLGRIHALGAAQPYRHRPALTIEHFGRHSVRDILASGFMPPYLKDAYRDLAEELLGAVEAAFERAGVVRRIRLHGDVHPGNILWTDAGPHFVDFDDSRMGPAVQDLWMLLSGERADMTWQLTEILDGYTQFHEFDARELQLIEALRTLRMMHYAAWLARRWEDPAFPRAFPWFDSPRYWESHIGELREQAARLAEPPLPWA